MAIDPATLEEICEAIGSEEDPVREAAAMATLVDQVARDPAGYFDALCVAATTIKSRDGYGWGLSQILEALRAVDVNWFHRALDLVPSDPAMWDVVRETGQLQQAFEYIGLPAISRAYQEYGRHDHLDKRYVWAGDIVYELCKPWSRAWGTEDLQRAVISRLIQDADDETIGFIAAGAVEDFLIDDHDSGVDLADRMAWVEHQAASDEKFRYALTMVWTSGMLPDIAERVDRARNFEEN